MVVARSSSGSVVAISYVLPVLWMTSRLVVMGRVAGVAIPWRSMMSMNALFSFACRRSNPDVVLSLSCAMRSLERIVALLHDVRLFVWDGRAL